jgi:hypothetical protein
VEEMVWTVGPFGPCASSWEALGGDGEGVRREAIGEVGDCVMGSGGGGAGGKLVVFNFLRVGD